MAKIVVGLGNPGKRYAATRHNAGFMVVEALARSQPAIWSPGMLSRTCRIETGGGSALLVEPLTYMNRSGIAVRAILSALGSDPRNLIVLLDDLSLPFGRIRIRERGSAGGHRGLESILKEFETDEIVRIRIGIGEDRMPEDKAGFVLSDFPPERQADLEDLITRAGNAVHAIINDGVSKAMAIFNA